MKITVRPSAAIVAQRLEQRRRPPAASAPRSARRGSGSAPRGRAPSGSRRAAARRARAARSARAGRRRCRSARRARRRAARSCRGWTTELPPSPRWSPRIDVLGDGERRDEPEVLVHHADPGVERVARRVRTRPARRRADLALVGPVEAGEDVRERALAGAVLAEQRVHLALGRLEVDAVVRDDAREPLGDPAQLRRPPLSGRRG